MQNTFVTPVFSGSTDLRQAAGQLIEEAAKAARRKKEMNDQLIETLYGDMTSLYHLDQIRTQEQGTAEETQPKEGIPQESRALLGAIAGAWILIGCGQGISVWKARKKELKKGSQ